MKKLTSIICLMFALIMIFALPAGASAPYQTYTYSINGTALHSPDAYNPVKTIDAEYMGLTDPAVLKKYYPSLSRSAGSARFIFFSSSSLPSEREG